MKSSLHLPLVRWVDGRVKDKVGEMAGAGKYEFGDLTKEIARRVSSRKYTLEDLALLLKALVSFGVGLSPVAGLLPVTLLVQLLNYSIAGDVGNRLVAALAQEIDRRLKAAIIGDADYKLGDVTKRSVGSFCAITVD